MEIEMKASTGQGRAKVGWARLSRTAGKPSATDTDNKYWIHCDLNSENFYLNDITHRMWIGFQSLDFIPLKSLFLWIVPFMSRIFWSHNSFVCIFWNDLFCPIIVIIGQVLGNTRSDQLRTEAHNEEGLHFYSYDLGHQCINSDTAAHRLERLARSVRWRHAMQTVWGEELHPLLVFGHILHSTRHNDGSVFQNLQGHAPTAPWPRKGVGNGQPHVQFEDVRHWHAPNRHRVGQRWEDREVR